MLSTYNLKTGELLHFSGINREETVIAAYAQELGDYNTWDYRTKYGHLLKRGRYAITCGDWTIPNLVCETNTGKL